MPDDKNKQQQEVPVRDRYDWDALLKDFSSQDTLNVDWDAWQNELENEIQQKENAEPTGVSWLGHSGGQVIKGLTESLAGSFEQLMYDMGIGPDDTVSDINPWTAIKGLAYSTFKFAGDVSNMMQGRVGPIYEAAKTEGNNFLKDNLFTENERDDMQVKKTQMLDFGQERREFLEELLPANEKYKDNFWLTDVPDAFGSTLGFAAAGLLFKNPALGSAMTGALAERRGMMLDAYQYTKDFDVIEEAGDKGTVLGMTEALPIEALYGKLAKFGKKELSKDLRKGFLGFMDKMNLKADKNLALGILKMSTLQGMEEFTQEFGQQLGENYTAQELYDANRVVMEGTLRGGAAGFVSGFLMSALGGAGKSLYLKTLQRDEKKKIGKMLKEQVENINQVLGLVDKGITYGDGINTVFNLGIDAAGIKVGKPSTEGATHNTLLSPEQEATGKTAIANGYGNDITTIVEEDKGKNIVRSLFKLGIRNASALSGAISTKENKYNFGIPLEKLQGLSEKELSMFVDNLYLKAIALGVRANIGEQIDLAELEGNEENKKQLKNDIIAAIVLDFKESGLDLLKAKYSSLGAESTAKVMNLIENVKSNNKKTLELGKAAVLSASSSLAGLINKKEISKLSKKLLDDTKRTVREGIANESPLVSEQNEELSPQFSQELNRVHDLPARLKDPNLLFPGEFEAYLNQLENLFNFPELYQGNLVPEGESDRLKVIVENSRLYYAQGKIGDAIANAEAALSYIHERAIDLQNASDYFYRIAKEEGLTDFKSEINQEQLTGGDISYSDIAEEAGLPDSLTLKSALDKLMEKDILIPGTEDIANFIKKHVADVTVKIISFNEQGDNKVVIDGHEFSNLKTRSSFGSRAATDNLAINGKTNSLIIINKDATGDSIRSLYTTVLHEGVHAILWKYRQHPEHKLFYSKLFKTLREVRQAYQQRDTQRIGSYAMKRLDDFTGKNGEAKIHSQMARLFTDTELTLGQLEEFMTHVLSGGEEITKVFLDIKIGPEKQSLIAKVFDAILEFFSRAIPEFLHRSPSGTLFDKINSMFRDELNTIDKAFMDTLGSRQAKAKQVFDAALKSKNESQGIDDRESISSMKIEDDLDNAQEDKDDFQDSDTIYEDIQTQTMVDFFATIFGQQVDEFRNNLKSMTYTEFNALLEKTLPKDKKVNDELTPESSLRQQLEQRLAEYYNGLYRKYKTPYDEWRKAFVVRMLNRAQEVNRKTFYNLEIRRNSYDKVSYKVVPLGKEFRDSEGKRMSSFAEDTVIEEFAEKLNEVYGLPSGTIKVAFINSFVNMRVDNNGRRSDIRKYNVKRLSDYKLGLEEGQGNHSYHIAQALWSNPDKINNRTLLYLGNMGDKSTLPVLTIDNNELDKFIEITRTFSNKYSEITNTENDMSSVVRGILEDLWYGAEFEKGQEGTPWTLKQSIYAFKDWNKTQKRGTKWVFSKKKAQQDWELIKDLFTTDDEVDDLQNLQYNLNKYSGIEVNPETGKVRFRAGVLNTTQLEEFPLVKIMDGDKEVELNLNDMLRNKYDGKSRFDGASFYIAGQLDVLYHRMYGVFKRGTLKNVISTGLESTDHPEFIKHAMHALHPSDPLAQWMIKNNIAILTADESAKVHSYTKEQDGQVKTTISAAELKNGLEKDDSRLFWVPMENVARYKEEHNVDFFGGKSRQAWNGSSMTSMNPYIMNANFDEALSALMRGILDKYRSDISERTLEKVVEDISKIAIAPDVTVPKQKTLSSILEGIFNRGLTTEQLSPLVSGLVQHPLIASQVNNRVRDLLVDTLSMTITGSRSALGPGLGLLAKTSQVDVITSRNNIAWLLTSLPTTDEVFKAAVPDSMLREYIRGLREDRRRLTLLARKAKTKAQKQAVEEYREHMEIVKQRIDDRVRSLMSEIETKVNEGDEEARVEYARYYQATIPEEGIKTKRKQNINALIDLSHPKVKEWQEEYIYGKPTKKNPDGSPDWSTAKGGIIDKATGHLKYGWGLISADIAQDYAIKPGDVAMSIVTPSDSPLAIGKFKVAAVVPAEFIENRKVILNSEYIQSLVGKDFDIDTTSIMPYDEDYWQNFLGTDKKVRNSFVIVSGEVGEDGHKAYLQGIAKETNKLFKEKAKILATLPGAVDKEGNLIEATEDNVMSDTIRTLYAQLLLGTTDVVGKQVFSPFGNDFYKINNAYMVKDIADVINMRLYHTLASSMNINYPKMSIPVFDSNGQLLKINEKDLKINNDNWFRTHVLHMVLTNHVVDFPNNTSLLNYQHDFEDPILRKKIFGLTWGISPEVLKDIDNTFVDVFEDIQSFLFGGLFRLAKGVNQFGEKYTLFDMMKEISDQKNILNALWNTKSKGDLKAAYLQHLGAQVSKERRRAKTKDEQAQVEASFNMMKISAESIFESIKVEDPENYPLAYLVSNIDLNSIPMYGIPRDEALIIESNIGLAIANSDPVIKKLLDEKIWPAITAKKDPLKREFIDLKTNKIYGDVKTKSLTGNPTKNTVALSLLSFVRNKDLDKIRRAAIALLQGLDEIKTNSDTEILNANREARAEAYPILFEELLKNPFISPTGDRISVNISTRDKRYITLRTDMDGQLYIKSDKGTEYKAADIVSARDMKEEDYAYASTPEGYSTLIGRDDKAKRQIDLSMLKRLLTNKKGVWSNANNRYELSQFVNFVENIPIDKRKELFKNYVARNLYKAKNGFTSEDIDIFWISLMGQVGNDGLRDRKAMNLSFNRAQMSEDKPYTYPYNDTLLELLSEFEKGLRDSYLNLFNRFAKDLDIKVTDVIEGIRSENVDEMAIMGEEDDGTDIVDETLFDTLYDNIERIDTSTFLRKEFKAFNKILDEPDGIAKGKKALAKLFADIDVLRTLNESGYDYSEVIRDLNKLSKTEFEKKYSGFNFGPIDDLFKKHHYLSQRKIVSDTKLDNTKNKLRQLFWIQFKAKQNEMFNVNLPKHIQGFLADENFSHMRERKVYANYDKDEIIGFSLVPGLRIPQALTPEKVARKFRIVPDSTPKPVGLASVAIRKASDLDLSLKLYQEEMKSKLTEIENILELFRDENKKIKKINESQDVRLTNLLRSLGESKLSELALRRKIFNIAENLKTRDGISVIEGSKPGTYLYVMQGEELTPYNSLLALLEKHKPKMSPEDQLAYLAAIEYRKVYDLHVREAIEAALNYLTYTHLEMTKTFDLVTEGMKYVAQAGAIYEEYKKAVDQRRGDYMPHSYPMHVYEQIWKSKQFETIKQALVQQVKAEQQKLKNGLQADNKLASLSNEDINQLTEDRLEHGWKRVMHGHPETNFIPNFQKRHLEDPEVDYDKISFIPHIEYVSRTIEGLRNDLKLADYYLYEKLAREAGESKGVLNSMRTWYSDQMTNKLMHTKKINLGSVKKGMAVSFLVRGLWVEDDNNNPVESETRVSGIVRKITKDRIYLFIEPGRAVEEAKRRLKLYENKHTAIADAPGNAPATAGQIKYYKELVQDGFAEDLSPTEWGDATVKSLNDKIFGALNNAIKNPDKLGSYQLRYIYTRNLNGGVNQEQVDRFIRRGAIEFLERKAQEVYNTKSIVGYWDNPVLDWMEWASLKLAKFLVDVPSIVYRKVMGYSLLAGLNAPKALSRNLWGFIFNNFMHSPRRSVSYAIEGMQKYFEIRRGNLDRLSDEERFIYNTLASMSLLNTKGVLTLALGTINLDRPEVILQRSTSSAMSRAFRLFNEATGYSNYVKKVKDLDKKYRISTDPNERRNIKMEQRLENRKWALKIQGILDSEKTYSATDIALLYREMLKKDPNTLKVNEAAQLGITKKKALMLFGKTLFNWFYESGAGLGMKTQALAEYGRVATMFVGYYMAKELGHAQDMREALLYGMNYTEAWNAMYQAQNKQRAANTKLGRTMMQFTQYFYNALSKSMRLYRDSIPQRIGNMPEGTLAKLKMMISRDIVTVEEQKKKTENQEYITMKDVNLSRLAFIRWLSHLTLLQLGVTGVLGGAQYVVDPAAQFMFGLAKLLKDIGQYVGGDDDDEEIKQALVEGSYEVLWMYGVPFKHATSIMLRPKDVTVVDAMASGRIMSQTGNLERLVNSTGILFGSEEMDRKETKKRVLDGDYIWNTILPFSMFGDRYYEYGSEPDKVETSNWLLGEREYRIPTWEGISDEDKPFLTQEDKFRILFEEPYKILPPFAPIFFY